jgi:hypothetical protein
VADGRAELIPLALVPRDQLWFYADAIQDRVQSAEESFLTPGPEPAPEPAPGAFEQSPAFEQSLATADNRARDQILRALKRLRRDPDSLALRIRPIEPHRRYLEARVGHQAALVLRRVAGRFVVIEFIHHRDKIRAARTAFASQQ